MDVTVGSLTFRVRGDDAQLRTLVNEWEARRLTLGVDVKGAAEGAAALGRLTTAVTELTGKLDALGGRQRVVVQEVERVDSGTRRAALGVSNLTAQLSRGAVGAQTYAQQTDILGRALRDVSAQEGIFSRETAVAEGALRKLAAVDLRALRQNATRELATVTQAVREANSLRLDWQNLRLSDSDTLARLEQQRRGYQNAQDALAGQISSLREKGVLDEAEMSRVDRLTRYYERYGQALRTLGSIEASIQGQIQKGSLADSVQRGTDAELRALTQAAREAAAGVRLLQDQERAGLITKRELLAALTQERTAITAQVTAIREEAAALRGLDAPSAQQLARLEALTTAERGYTAALAQTARAQQEVARSQSVVRAGLMGAGGNGRLNDAAMAASFVSPELGMLGMAATAGPWVAGAAAAGVFGKALTDAAGKAADFRAQLQQVQAVSGLSGEAINRYGEFVQRLSTQLPVTTAQLTEMGRQAVMVGLHGEEGMRVYTQNMAALSVILRDVTGESQDLERTGQEIVKVLRAVGMNSDEVTQNFGRMVNGMVALKTESGVMIPEVTQLLKFWASQGAHMGLTIEQMTALSAALIQTGARAQGAGGALAIFYDKAAAAAAKGVSGITPWARIIGLTADETARLLKTDPMAFLQRFVDGVNRAEKNGTALALSLGSVDLNSQQVRRTLAELTQALPLLNNNIRVMNEGADDTGRALDVAQEAAQNYRDKMQMLHSAVNRIIVDLGGPLAETFTGWLTALEPLVVKVGDLIEKLNKVKSPGELKALLKIDWAKDSGTTVAYKLFLGSFQQMKEVKEAAGQNPILTGIGMVLSGRVAAGTLQAAGRDAYVRNVRSQLVDMGVLPSTGDPKVIKQQLELVAENLGKYEAMLAQRINQGAQAIRAAAGQPAPINVAAQAFNATGPLLPNQYRTDPSKEAGNFSYAFISQLAGVFKNDPRVASDCAIIAYEILNQLGIKIKGSAVQNANVGVLEKNAIASGFQKVDGQEIRPGDLVIWTSGNGKTYGVSSGKHAGVVAGFDGKNLKVIENPGTRNGRDSITQVVSMYDWQNATVYRAPNSPFATGKPTAPRSSSAPAPADQESPITAAQVVKAQQLLAAVEKTQAALKAKPGDVGLTKALDAATTAMNNWSKAAPEHARALAAVRAGMGGTAEAARTASGA